VRYAFLLWGDEAAETSLAPEESRRIIEAHGAFADDMRRENRYVAGAGLLPSNQGRILRGSDRDVVTDGPFLETKEQLGGLYLLECADDDEALQVAGRIPRSPGLAVEVRAAPY
jgi:hypothetical protein